MTARGPITLTSFQGRSTILCALVVFSGCSASVRNDGVAVLAAPRASSHCVEHDGLPDPRCTPGATRNNTPLATICAYGYSRAVRPPESYTEALKFKQMRAYHLPGPASRYEEDHLVPLSIGGAPRDPANLWLEPRTGPNNATEKDELETWTARNACTGRIPLHVLQHDMAHDWTSLYRAAGGARSLAAYPPGG